MPKMKTHSGSKKRFRKTATGKLRGRRAYSTHILEKKSPKRKRRFARPVEISGNDAKRVRKQVKGYFGRKHSSYRLANEQVMRSGQYAYRDRRRRKREMRRLWIVRINAAARREIG